MHTSFNCWHSACHESNPEAPQLAEGQGRPRGRLPPACPPALGHRYQRRATVHARSLSGFGAAFGMLSEGCARRAGVLGLAEWKCKSESARLLRHIDAATEECFWRKQPNQPGHALLIVLRFPELRGSPGLAKAGCVDRRTGSGIPCVCSLCSRGAATRFRSFLHVSNVSSKSAKHSMLSSLFWDIAVQDNQPCTRPIRPCLLHGLLYLYHGHRELRSS